jgi:hydrogenase maturation protease
MIRNANNRKKERAGGRNSLLFAGLGNSLKSDDGVGIYIAGKLKDSGVKRVIIAESSIENYIGVINREKAQILILIDAVDFGEDPGFFALVPVDKLKDTTTGTHSVSLRVISLFLKTPEKWVLGVQPQNVSVGTELSEKVRSVSDQIVKTISGTQELLQSAILSVSAGGSNFSDFHQPIHPLINTQSLSCGGFKYRNPWI